MILNSLELLTENPTTLVVGGSVRLIRLKIKNIQIKKLMRVFQVLLTILFPILLKTLCRIRLLKVMLTIL